MSLKKCATNTNGIQRLCPPNSECSENESSFVSLTSTSAVIQLCASDSELIGLVLSGIIFFTEATFLTWITVQFSPFRTHNLFFISYRTCVRYSLKNTLFSIGPVLWSLWCEKNAHKLRIFLYESVKNTTLWRVENPPRGLAENPPLPAHKNSRSYFIVLASLLLAVPVGRPSKYIRNPSFV